MFTGIVRWVSPVIDLKKDKETLLIAIKKPSRFPLKTGDSIACNGICLTIEKETQKNFLVRASIRTLNKTNIKTWKKNYMVNLEPPLTPKSFLGGHIVTGHIDTTATLHDIKKSGKNLWFYFRLEEDSPYLALNGSIAVNGVSLTIAFLEKNIFGLLIIPYTYENTNFKYINVEPLVNVEFDIIAKYIKKMI